MWERDSTPQPKASTCSHSTPRPHRGRARAPLAFHPSGETVYLIGELSGTITAYDYDPEGGRLHAEQTVSTVPDDFGGAAASADFHVHPSGNFLYASNQGDANDLVVYRIDADTGGLTYTGQSIDAPAPTKTNFVPRPNGAAPSTER